MNLLESKEKFIHLWGTLGSEWGISRTMAQVHALLLVAPEPISTDEVMERLNISRGNANMNLRDLIAWGLVFREIKQGERKDYFRAEKDLWQVARCIAVERKKRELDPMLRCIEELLQAAENNREDSKEELQTFKGLLSEIKNLGNKSSALLELVFKLDQSAFFKPLLKLFK